MSTSEAAWCEQCQEGYRGYIGDVENWEAQHDAENHPENP